MLSRFGGISRKSSSTHLGKRCRGRSTLPVYHVFAAEVDEARHPKQSEEKTPVITCKQRKFNFYLQDKPSKKDTSAVKLASGRWLNKKSKGDYFTIHPLSNVSADPDTPYNGEEFSDFKLDPSILSRLTESDIRKPTLIQALAIPEILSGCDSILAAETGCGKTLAYLLPIIERISGWKKLANGNEAYNSPYAVIVTPSKELAEQIGVEASKFASNLGIKSKVITNKKARDLINYPPVDNVDILIGSLGLLSKLFSLRLYKLDLLRHIVLDEADALFHETFSPLLRSFLQRTKINCNNETVHADNTSKCREAVQLTLVSATMPQRTAEVLDEIVSLSSLRVFTTENLHRIHVPQKFLRLGPGQKPGELLRYMKPKLSKMEPVIIFSNENRTCNWVKMFLEEASIDVLRINGAMSLNERRGLYEKFVNGETRILSTTNAGSRGLDTGMVKHVLNYDLPSNTADYVHRCGRTGRMGRTRNCSITSFVSTARDIALVKLIEKAARSDKPIPLVDLYQEIAMQNHDALGEQDFEHLEEM